MAATVRSRGMESLRAITDALWIADAESALALRSEFEIVIDCTGEAPLGGNVYHCRPTGATGHTWTEDDLDWIAQKGALYLGRGKNVLVHCRRGVSRSPCAAAAILLATGQAGSVDAALAMTTLPGTSPATQSVAGLRRWWKAREAARQQTLPGLTRR